MPVVRSIVRERRAGRTTVSLVRAWHREQRAVPDAEADSRSIAERMTDLIGYSLEAGCSLRKSIFPGGRSFAASAPLSRCRFSTRWCPRRRRCGRPPPPQAAACRIEMVHGAAGCSVEGLSQALLVAGQGGRATSTSRSACAARAVSRLRHDRQRHGSCDAEPGSAREEGGDHNRSSAVFLTAAPPEADRRFRFLGRRVDRPDLRAEVRSGHAASFDPVVHRERRIDIRRLRLRLQLRLLDRDLLGIADRAAPDRARSASRVRAPVWRRRDDGGAPRRRRRIAASSTASARGRPAAAGPRARRSKPADEYLESVREIERRLQNVEKRTPAQSASCPTRRLACPTRSKSTRG